MQIDLRIGGHKLLVVWRPYREVTGMSSRLPDGRHVLMWDFDTADVVAVLDALRAVQRAQKLPVIHVLRSSPGGCHAYCFVRCNRHLAFSIVEGTAGVDPGFVKLSEVRGYFTLRYSEKRPGETFEHVADLACPDAYNCWETADPSDLREAIQYQTMHI